MSEEKPLGNPSETTEGHLKKPYTAQLPTNANYSHYAKGRWTPISDCFMDLRLKGTIDQVQHSVATMLLRWAYQNYKLYEFEMSRRELAKIANTGEKQAQATLRILVQLGLLEEVYKQKGAHSLYRWNVDKFVENAINLGRIDPTPGSESIRLMSLLASGPESIRPNTYIKEFIKLKFFLKISASSDVDNSGDKSVAATTAADPSGDAVRGNRSVAVTMTADSPEYLAVIASWEEAIEVCARAYGYDRVHLCIENVAIRWFWEPEPRKALAALCRDSELITELRERFPHFATNKDFALFASREWGKVFKLCMAQKFKGVSDEHTVH